MPKLTFLGHACFLLEEEGKDALIFDPFLTGNPMAAMKAEDVRVKFVLVSHGHQDHIGDSYNIAEANYATIISTSEIASDAQENGLAAHAMNTGGKYNFPFGWVKITLAFHAVGSPSYFSCGFVVNYYGKNIYFAGDTGLFSDMKLIGEGTPLDLALLPIGDNYTMGIDDAVIAASYLNAKTVIPYHYNTMPVIMADPQEFKKKTEEKTNSSCIVLAPGESFNL